MTIRLPVHTAVCPVRASGALTGVILVQVSFSGSYRPPLETLPSIPGPDSPSAHPPQTIIKLPVQTAVWQPRGTGACTLVVGVQVSVSGSYRPPLLVSDPPAVTPPHTTIKLPVHTAVWPERAR